MHEVVDTPQVRDDGPVEEFICHLYPFHSQTTFCGISSSDDAHCQMHQDHKQKSPTWFHDTGGPEERCPACGAPVCRTCLRRS